MRKRIVKESKSNEIDFRLVSIDNRVTVYKEDKFIGMIVYKNNFFSLMITCTKVKDCFQTLRGFLSHLMDAGYDVYVE